MNGPKASLQPGITVHCLVRNEERFIRSVILSILPLAERVLVYDTGSTDATLDILRSIQSDKLDVIRKTFSHPHQLAEFRNEMAERTTTEWFMVVDGDEIYPTPAVRRIVEEIEKVPPTAHRIVIHRRHFVGSMNFISQIDKVGRMFRTAKIRFRTGPAPRYRPRNDAPYLRDDPCAPLECHSLELPEGIFFFHCQYLTRSSKDDELGPLRKWRWGRKIPPLPVLPYFGPWPEAVELNGLASHVTPGICWRWVNLNTEFLGRKGLIIATKAGRKVTKTFWR